MHWFLSTAIAFSTSPSDEKAEPSSEWQSQSFPDDMGPPGETRKSIRRSLRRERQRDGWQNFGRYLQRPLGASARFLDHGVLQVAAFGGEPHLYRVDLGLGLFDHLSIGVTAHVVPDLRLDQPPTRFQWAPWASLAFYRSPKVEVGAHYRELLHRPPDPEPLIFNEGDEVDSDQPLFQSRSRLLVASLTANRWLFSGGLDLGMAWIREVDDRVDPETLTSKDYVQVLALASGLHLRFGTRRWGVSASAMTLIGDETQFVGELGIDLRLGLFEKRGRGGWRP